MRFHRFVFQGVVLTFCSASSAQLGLHVLCLQRPQLPICNGTTAEQSARNAPVQTPGSVLMPEGIYFIVNVASGLALQSQDTEASDLTLAALNRNSAVQKWQLLRVRDSKSGQMTPRFTIQSAGPAPFFLQPLPDRSLAAGVRPERIASYSFHPSGRGHLIRSFQLQGTPLGEMPGGHGNVRFAAAEDIKSRVWQLIPSPSPSPIKSSAQ